ncbi:MAG: hypothetical protein ACKOW3_01485 [Hyphomicrobium sp.]
MAQTQSSEQVYALVSILWILSALAIAVSAITIFTTNSLSVLTLNNDKVSTEAIVRAGLEYSVLKILQTKPDKASKGQSNLRLKTGTVQTVWKGETGRVDLNTGQPKLITQILIQSGANETQAVALTNAILKRRQSKGQPQPQIQPQPQNSQAPGGPNSPAVAQQVNPQQVNLFRNIGELSEVGVPINIIKRMTPLVTVLSGKAQIDPRLASTDLLSALPGMTEPRLRRLIALRDSGVTDRNQWSQEAGDAMPYFSFDKSPSVRITIESQLNNGMRSNTEVVIINYTDDTEPYRILSWDELPTRETRKAREEND